MSSRYQNLRDIDHRHLWHPFTQAQLWETFDPLIVERAEGMELIDVDGRRYLDGISSLWCNVHGYGVPEILKSMSAQAARVCHSTLLGLSHEPILNLTKSLLEFLPSELTRVFYSDSGSAAVEAGLRMAVEFWQKQADRSARMRTKLVSFEGSYHGDTLGAVGVGFSESFHGSLARVVVQSLRTPPPHIFRFEKGMSESEAASASLASLRELFKREGQEMAAFVLEPIVQGAAGIWIHSADYLRQVANIVREHGALLIVDEVATGFGKTGRMFAFEWAGIVPDVLIVGKGLSGGYLPISAAISTERIFAAFRGKPEEMRQFFFGQTFAGNPLAAAASIASLDLLRTDKTLSALHGRIEHFGAAIEREITPLPHVDEVRRAGLMTGIELTAKPGARVAYPVSELAGHRVVLEARKRGLVIRPLGNVLVLMPALAMNTSDLSRLVSVTAESISAALEK